MSTRLALATLILTGTLAVAGGCASQPGYKSYATQHFVAADMAPAPGGHEIMQEAGVRSLIQTADLRVTVPEVEPAAVKAAERITALGGLVDRTDLEEDRGHLSLRVPSSDLEAALDNLGGLGEVTHREIASQDVTEQQIDLQARLENLRTLRDRLRELLDRADTVKDILEVQRELTRVQSELDSLTRRLESLNSRVAMASIQLELKRKVTLGPVAWVGAQVYRVVEKLFVW